MAEAVRVPVAEGVELAADVWPGEGPPFLLLHGLASNRQLWRPVAERLAAAGHAVATLDLRGHGESDRPEDGYDFRTVSADVVTAARALGLERPVLVGQSYGGNLVLEIADRHDAAVRGVAAVDGGVLDLGSRFSTWDDCATAMSPPTIDMSPEELRSHIADHVSGWPDGALEAAMGCYETSSQGRAQPRLARAHHLAILRSMWEHSPTQLLGRLSVPVLLLPCDTGDADWTAHKRDTIAAVRRKGSDLRVRWFEAHHDVHLQQPDGVAGALLAAENDGFFA